MFDDEGIRLWIAPLHEDVIERLWSKADRSGGDGACWEWQGALFAHGYPVFNAGLGRSNYGHRLVVEWAIGRPLARGEFACHSCDNRKCVNPAHLWAGSAQDNIDDKVRKGRHPHGESSSAAKLTEADVRAIRAAASAGAQHKDLAERFGVQREAIGKITRRERWRHVA